MKSVIIIGGGTSVKEGIELGLWDKIKDKEIWSLNYTFKFMPYLPSKEIWIDRAFFKANLPYLQDLSKHGVECISTNNTIYTNIPEIKTYQHHMDPKQYNKDSEIIFKGTLGLTGIFALSLAIYLKYDLIYLLGYDFGTSSVDNTNTHFYQDLVRTKRLPDINDNNVIYSTGVGVPTVYMGPNNQTHQAVNDFVLFLLPHIKIFNVSLKSRILHFPKISFEEFFTQINE